MSEPVPSLGRIVLVRLSEDGPELPALVTCVHSNTCLNVRVFPDDERLPFRVTSLQPQDFQPATGVGWRWPPRV